MRRIRREWISGMTLRTETEEHLSQEALLSRRTNCAKMPRVKNIVNATISGSKLSPSLSLSVPLPLPRARAPIFHDGDFYANIRPSPLLLLLPPFPSLFRIFFSISLIFNLPFQIRKKKARRRLRNCVNSTFISTINTR